MSYITYCNKFFKLNKVCIGTGAYGQVYEGQDLNTKKNQHKHIINNNKGQQTTLSKFYKLNKNTITDMRWSILHKIIEYVPDKN